MEYNFGKNIRNLRKASDITQEALAGALGVSSQSVSKWETGYGFPDITQLPAIANYFGVTIDELFSNNDAAREAAREEFQQKFYTFDVGSEEVAVLGTVKFSRKAVFRQLIEISLELRLVGVAYKLHPIFLCVSGG